jgi:hypothetical protein
VLLQQQQQLTVSFFFFLFFPFCDAALLVFGQNLAVLET